MSRKTTTQNGDVVPSGASGEWIYKATHTWAALEGLWICLKIIHWLITIFPIESTFLGVVKTPFSDRPICETSIFWGE